MKTNKTTHTPGSWEYRKTADTFHVGHPVFGVGPKINGAVYFVAEQMNEADARLISASPDLLSAVKAARKILHPNLDFGPCAFNPCVLCAAIAKAEGR